MITDVYEPLPPERCPCGSSECEEDYKQQVQMYDIIKYQATIKTTTRVCGGSSGNKTPGLCKDGLAKK